MNKSEIIKKLFVMQADILAINKAISELLEELAEDRVEEPTNKVTP